ncbi:MAG: tetratricopeptide repeat protein, partial [Deltaproteobacteria bacterium]|nr:tetratricopeptide repeat protein [Deltaproteobacteria bacterium]
IETLYALGELRAAGAAADRALADWPGSRRARIGKALVLLASGKPTEAGELLDKAKDLDRVPRALAVRGLADAALGKLDAAKTKFKDALAEQPNLELAVVGRAWLHLGAGEAAEAKALAGKLYKTDACSLAVATVYAAALARTSELDKAKTILERATRNAGGIEIGRAQLELARVARDLGDTQAARRAYEKAIATGSFEARLESAQLFVDNADPGGGRESFEQLLKTTEQPSVMLQLETARVRMLTGDDAGAEQLLAQVDKALGASGDGKLRWMLDRERGRLAMRKVDYAGAAGYLKTALDGCGDDAETFLLAADVAAADEKRLGELAAKVKKLADDRLGKRPEALLVQGKLLALTPARAEDAQKLFADALRQLESDKASRRRKAQARLGLGVVAYMKDDDGTAESQLIVALDEDPSLYAAYIYAAEISKDLRKAIDLAKKAVQYNPRVPEAWFVLGSLASRAKDRALLAESIGRLNALTPGSELVTQLQLLR